MTAPEPDKNQDQLLALMLATIWAIEGTLALITRCHRTVRDHEHLPTRTL